jgi:puromycin-sensitive aminopeptidase
MFRPAALLKTKFSVPSCLLRAKLATASASLMDAVIVYSCGGFSSSEKATEIEAFFAAHPLPSNQRKLSQTLERIRINAKFLDQLKSQIGKDDFWKELATR